MRLSAGSTSRVLNRPATPILHRQSFTIVEAKQRKVLEKFDLELKQLFDGLEKTALSLAEKSVASESAGLFAEVEEKLTVGFDADAEAMQR